MKARGLCSDTCASMVRVRPLSTMLPPVTNMRWIAAKASVQSLTRSACVSCYISWMSRFSQ